MRGLLTNDEFAEVVANCDHLQNLKYRPTLPYAFTEYEQIGDLRKLLMLYIEKNDKRVNEIIIALNNLIDAKICTT